MKDTNATVHYAGNDYFIAVTPSGHAQTIDISADRNSAAGPLELLLIALGGCTGADVISVLHKKRAQVTDYRIEIHGDRREEHPRSFRRIEVRHILKGRGLNKESVARAIELSESKYCSVAATLRPAAEIISTFEIQEDAEAAPHQIRNQRRAGRGEQLLADLEGAIGRCYARHELHGNFGGTVVEWNDDA